MMETRQIIPALIGLTGACLFGVAPVMATAANSHQSKTRLHQVQRGKASYYRPAGKITASGHPARPQALTAASKTLPLGARAKVTNVETGKSVRVTITDRGPYAKGRILDVSPKAAEKLGMKDDGVAPVKVKPESVPAKD